MKKTARRLDHTKEKLVGEIKEAAGKITGNEKLELKGKIQSSKADIKMKVYEVKDDLANAFNHAIDHKGKR